MQPEPAAYSLSLSCCVAGGAAVSTEGCEEALSHALAARLGAQVALAERWSFLQEAPFDAGRLRGLAVRGSFRSGCTDPHGVAVPYSAEHLGGLLARWLSAAASSFSQIRYSDKTGGFTRLFEQRDV